nr:hypothetical protein [Kibdelosporangium sp. MJ126-NF4]CTQ93943.1 hypothetical protein [Kibdelosporangium sp. MJ126-NF4]
MVTKQAAELGTTLGEKLVQTARAYDEVDAGVRDIMKEI